MHPLPQRGWVSPKLVGFPNTPPRLLLPLTFSPYVGAACSLPTRPSTLWRWSSRVEWCTTEACGAHAGSASAFPVRLLGPTLPRPGSTSRAADDRVTSLGRARWPRSAGNAVRAWKSDREVPARVSVAMEQCRSHPRRWGYDGQVAFGRVRAEHRRYTSVAQIVMNV